jgi:hypothetical protein
LEDEGEQHLTCHIMDILKYIEKLQKNSQKSKIIMTDIELVKKVAVDLNTLMENESYPEGIEEKLMNYLASENIEETNKNITEEILRKRHNVNSLISTKKCWFSVRKEVTLSYKEFLLAVDQEIIKESTIKFTDGRSSIETIQVGRTGVLNLFGEHVVSCFIDDAISLYAAKKFPPPLEMNNSTAKMDQFNIVLVQRERYQYIRNFKN